MKKGKSRYWLYAAAVIVVLAAVFYSVKGCAFMPWNSSRAMIPVRVTVTRHFGSEVLKDEEVTVEKPCSAMQALQQVAEVETAYGGGFINAVDGLESDYGGGGDSGKSDWFYYLNGQMSDGGAGDYEVHDGDWVLFDYHSWEYSMFSPALAGCFPEPFVHGYGKPPESCTVIYAAGWEEEGRELLSTMQGLGATACSLRELEEGWRPGVGDYTVVLGTCDELYVTPFWPEANDNASRLGLYAFFQEGELVIVDEQGRVARRLSSGAGLVEAVGPRLGEEDTALVVTGTDREGVEAALELLKGRDNDIPPVMVIAVLAGEGELEVPAR